MVGKAHWSMLPPELQPRAGALDSDRWRDHASNDPSLTRGGSTRHHPSRLSSRASGIGRCGSQCRPPAIPESPVRMRTTQAGISILVRARPARTEGGRPARSETTRTLAADQRKYADWGVGAFGGAWAAPVVVVSAQLALQGPRRRAGPDRAAGPTGDGLCRAGG